MFRVEEEVKRETNKKQAVSRTAYFILASRFVSPLTLKDLRNVG
jgi:hypothetical protein